MLAKIKKRWAWIAVVCALPILLLWFVIGDSGYFDGCVARGGYEPAQQQQAAKENSALVRLQGARLMQRCIGSFVVHFNAAITALATVLLGIVTGGLVYIGYLQISTARAQLRAYLHLQSAAIVDGLTADPPLPDFANIPCINLTIRNSGQTPGYSVQSWADIAIIDMANEHGLTIPHILPKESNSLGAGMEMPKSIRLFRKLSDPEVADIRASVKRIYVYGRVEYVSLGIRRSTDFRLFYTGNYPPHKGHTLTYAEGGNRSD